MTMIQTKEEELTRTEEEQEELIRITCPICGHEIMACLDLIFVRGVCENCGAEIAVAKNPETMDMCMRAIEELSRRGQLPEAGTKM